MAPRVEKNVLISNLLKCDIIEKFILFILVIQINCKMMKNKNVKLLIKINVTYGYWFLIQHIFH